MTTILQYKFIKFGYFHHIDIHMIINSHNKVVVYMIYIYPMDFSILFIIGINKWHYEMLYTVF